MCTPISVSISGPALSFLLYENSKCRFQQEGFLLGEIVHNETKTITDNDQQQVNVSTTIKINSMMPCPLPHYFYNGTGKISENILRDFLGKHFSNVVAWYKYQRISSFKFTFRDKIIHKQLTELFNVPSDLFSCCLLINEISDTGSTHLYSQAFIRCNVNVYDKLPIHIPNLSEPNNTYRSSEPASDTFNKILSDLKIDRKNTLGLVAINKIQNAVQKHIDSVVEQLSEREKYLYELEEELKQIEIIQKLKKLNEEPSTSTENSTHSPEIFPEVPRNSSSVIDTSSQENSPEVQRKTTTTRGRGKGKRRSVTKEAKEVNSDLPRLRRKD